MASHRKRGLGKGILLECQVCSDPPRSRGQDGMRWARGLLGETPVKDDGWRLENRVRALGPWCGADLWGGGGQGVSDGGAFPRKFWPGCPGVLEPVSCENGSALRPPPSKVIGWEPLWAAWPWCGRDGDPRSICPLSAHFHARCTNVGGTSGGLSLGARRPPLLQLLTRLDAAPTSIDGAPPMGAVCAEPLRTPL